MFTNVGRETAEAAKSGAFGEGVSCFDVGSDGGGSREAGDLGEEGGERDGEEELRGELLVEKVQEREKDPHLELHFEGCG